MNIWINRKLCRKLFDTSNYDDEKTSLKKQKCHKYDKLGCKIYRIQRVWKFCKTSQIENKTTFWKKSMWFWLVKRILQDNFERK